MGFVRPPMKKLVPVVTRLVYGIYTGLAIAASEAALRIFDKDAEYSCSKGMFGIGEKVCKIPIKFCFGNEDGGTAFCMDAGPIKSTVTVATGVSLAAIIMYVILDLVVRCRKKYFQALGGVSAGVAAGFGVALSFLLFGSMWSFLTIGKICDL